VSNKSAKKYKVKILWTGAPVITIFPGDDVDEMKQRTYDFRSKQERDAFLRGVGEAIGWNSFEIVKEAEYDE
jgi:hypothetical protein